MQAKFLRRGAITAVVALCAAAAPVRAQTLLGVSAGQPTLYRIDAATGATTLVGAIDGLQGSVAVTSLTTVGTRLFALSRSAQPGFVTSINEIDPCTGELIQSHPLTLDGAPAPGLAESLADDGAGNLVCGYSPTNGSFSRVLARISSTGQLAVITTFGQPHDDFDGLCPAGDGGFFAINREPGSSGDLVRVVRIPADLSPTSVLATIPFTATFNGVNDVARLGPALYTADFLTLRLHRLSAQTGALESSTVLSPAVALNAVTTVPPLLGDADHNLVVNFTDVTAVLTNFGVTYPPGTATGAGDADASNAVSFADVTAVLANFGASCL